MFPWAFPTAHRPPYQFFLSKVQEMIDPNPKNMENKSFEINPFSLKTILSAHRKQFWQTLRIVCAKGPK